MCVGSIDLGSICAEWNTVYLKHISKLLDILRSYQYNIINMMFTNRFKEKRFIKENWKMKFVALAFLQILRYKIEEK